MRKKCVYIFIVIRTINVSCHRQSNILLPLISFIDITKIRFLLEVWAFVGVGFCLCGILSVWAFVGVGFCRYGAFVGVGFCRCGLLSVWAFVGVGFCRCWLLSCGLLSLGILSCGLLSPIHYNILLNSKWNY